MKYPNVKLTRPLNKDSTQIGQWLASMQSQVKRTTAHIVAMSPGNKTVAEWHLDGVIPVKWTGPSFSLDSPKVCTETLELAHHGFLKA
jgi:phage tail-like protein